MNYEEATNQELNQRLTRLVFNLGNWSVGRCGRIFYMINAGGHHTHSVVKFCTDWGQTMPLAIEHGISVLSCGGDYEVSYDYYGPSGAHGCDEELTWHINVKRHEVLRAIVICLIKKLEQPH